MERKFSLGMEQWDVETQDYWGNEVEFEKELTYQALGFRIERVLVEPGGRQVFAIADIPEGMSEKDYLLNGVSRMLREFEFPGSEEDNSLSEALHEFLTTRNVYLHTFLCDEEPCEGTAPRSWRDWWERNIVPLLPK